MTKAVRAGTLEELSEAECLDVLRRGTVGRVVFVDHGQPVAVPVNYVVDHRSVAFRTDPGFILDGVTLGRISFEIDGIDESTLEGWSVLVKGIGRDLTDGIDEWSQRVTANNLKPWAAGDRRHWIAVAHPSISGRRVRGDES